MEMDGVIAQQLDRERRDRAKLMSPESRMRDGMLLFAGVCQRMKAGIRDRFPNMSEVEVHEALIQQLEKLDRVENRLREYRS